MSNSLPFCGRLFEKLKTSNRIGILGFGREGKSTLKFLHKYFPDKQICISDKNAQAFLNTSETGQYLSYFSEKNWLEIFGHVEILFISPGIPLFGIKIPDSVLLTSQTDFVLENFHNKIIGITGTKGKSTTSSLMQHVLLKKYSHVPLAGNIGIPPLDVIEELTECDYAVFEISSHQLQYTQNSPHYALLLNIFEEHLDYYPGFELYAKMKLNIYKNQQKFDMAVINPDVARKFEDIERMTRYVNRMYYSMKDIDSAGSFLRNNKICYRNSEGVIVEIFDIASIPLKGIHNLSNFLAVAAIASHIGLSTEEIKQAFISFKGLPHRLEFIPTSDGKVYYNDSISTIPESTIAAVQALHPVQTLIIGGMDRHISYQNFIQNLCSMQVENLCFYGEAGERIYQLMTETQPESGKNVIFTEKFDDIVTIAMQLTAQGGICLLSPAASSYDQFRNFEERGEKFRKLITR